MKALLDTHTFLWWVTNDPLLSANRILIAQSQLEGMPILTADSKNAQYGVDVIW